MLLAVVLYNAAGYMLVFQYLRYQVKKQAFADMQTLPSSLLIEIRLLVNDISSVIREKDKIEIRLNGKMYDVVRYSDSAGVRSYFCIQDHKEEKLIQSARLLHQQSDNAYPLKKNVRLILDHMIKICTHLSKEQPRQWSFSTLLSDCRQFAYTEPFSKVSAPPPQYNF